ncbi:hypothetical protein VV02_25350 [Luteipulveratus mongoliensis]|uniref:Uncharacterized protein n=2 Tax=Luteipulveratus mongoliensis TaxID=571913 RepID=A0A0K1JNU4_9MICO|nr:hypothetical protein VV02_25350 [Luteipulveratus mongoliensis]
MSRLEFWRFGCFLVGVPAAVIAGSSLEGTHTSWLEACLRVLLGIGVALVLCGLVLHVFNRWSRTVQPRDIGWSFVPVVALGSALVSWQLNDTDVDTEQWIVLGGMFLIAAINLVAWVVQWWQQRGDRQTVRAS